MGVIHRAAAGETRCGHSASRSHASLSENQVCCEWCIRAANNFAVAEREDKAA